MEPMEPYYVEIKDAETSGSIMVDMEGPYHSKKERIGEHIYGVTILIDDVPYHFEKYIPAEKGLQKFQGENEGEPCHSEDTYLYRIIPFTE